jgi:DNA-binding CsgD family transcriptional regulator
MSKMRIFSLFLLLLNVTALFGQYQFSGEVSKENAGNAIYLSLVEDYRKSSRVYLDQIVKKGTIDSLGQFYFEGDNLSMENRIYRIHLDGCSDESAGNHFLGQCNNSKAVLFIANNRDTLQFPTSFEEQSLCTINSTNPKSGLIQEIEFLKEQMAYDFMDFPSEANKKLNLDKWFSTLHEFGKASEEPLAELFIYDFLSDKRNETYSHYLTDLAKNDYYTGLAERLDSTYPNASFTQEYYAEITTDKNLAGFGSSSLRLWEWAILFLMTLSLLANIYFITNRRQTIRSRRKTLYAKLTPQEQKIVECIFQNMSNKEIASELFVSLSTVKTHINNLYKKLDVSSRDEMVELFRK